MTMKTCISCKTDKPATPEFFFYRNKQRGWFSSWCKECRSVNREKTKEAELASQRARRGIKPCVSCNSQEKEKGKMYCSACFSEKKRGQKKADKAVYKSRLRKAMPAWADKDKIREIYKQRPAGMHVDHIVPLRGEFVCGLHVEYNLEYLPEAENMKKSNSFNDGNHFSIEHGGRK